MPNAFLVRFSALLCFIALAWAQYRTDGSWSPRLILEVVDAETGVPLAARFSIFVDGREHKPAWVGPHGLRFVSVHVSKRQVFTATFSRGTGPVEVPLPAHATSAEIHVTKGFDYLPAMSKVEVASDPAKAKIRLSRWNKLHAAGWRAADTHVHYDRVEPSADRDWFDMMAADDLTYAEFMTLKGGMVPGVWARQYAYGSRGVGSEDKRLIIPGEEYRDRLQGHLLLFGLEQIIQPIMAGTAESPYNWPPFVDVLTDAREDGGFVGAAHGGTLGSSPTVVGDALLGRMDFMEIAWMGRWALDHWYDLANCGHILPPTGGTDLPNFPYRDPWQPFLGSTRTYARVGDAEGIDAFHDAIRQGKTFVTSGPIIRFRVNGHGPGEVVRLPAGGGVVEIEARLESPREVRGLEIVHNGSVIEVPVQKKQEGAIRVQQIRSRLRVNESSWMAARGRGASIASLRQEAFAHTAAVQVFVGDRPIRSPETARQLVSRLKRQKKHYQTVGNYADQKHQQRMMDLLDQAISRLSQ